MRYKPQKMSVFVTFSRNMALGYFLTKASYKLLLSIMVWRRIMGGLPLYHTHPVVEYLQVLVPLYIMSASPTMCEPTPASVWGSITYHSLVALYIYDCHKQGDVCAAEMIPPTQ